MPLLNDIPTPVKRSDTARNSQNAPLHREESSERESKESLSNIKEAFQTNTNSAPEKLPNDEKVFHRLDIPDSVQLLLLVDDSLRLGIPDANGEIFSLHPWQVETNKDICYGRQRENGEVVSEKRPTSIHPYQYALCAANGSGKDAFVIAPIALWFIVTKIQSKVIITSASAGQLNTQTEKYIRNLAAKINVWAMKTMGFEIIEARRRHYTCTLTGSEIFLFATDEEEKAEGHHPTIPGAEMMLIVNEAKSVQPEIFEALNRCTGYNYWIDVSSPGEPIGHFHRHFTNWPNKRRVSYFDCPHHSKQLFDQDRVDYGEHSAYFRSKWLALFTFIGGRYVVSHEKLENLRRLNKQNFPKPICQSEPIRVGIDIALSTNGDETVITFWRGNKQLAQKEFRIQDSTILAVALEQELQKQGIERSHGYIFADDGGVGRSVIDIMNRKGYRIRRVLNNSASRNKRAFKNKGAQTWYKFSRLIEEGVLIFKNPNDDKLFTQIASRKYKESDGGIDRMTLQSKKDMMSEGFPSPDRADACVLAFTDIDLSLFLDEGEKALLPDDKKEETFEEVIARVRNDLRGRTERYKLFNETEGKKKRIHLSQQIALN